MLLRTCRLSQNKLKREGERGRGRERETERGSNDVEFTVDEAELDRGNAPSVICLSPLD